MYNKNMMVRVDNYGFKMFMWCWCCNGRRLWYSFQMRRMQYGR